MKQPISNSADDLRSPAPRAGAAQSSGGPSAGGAFAGDLLADASERLLSVAQWASHRCIVAVSGGADSVALLLTMNQLLRQHRSSGQQPADLRATAHGLLVVHVNHGLRGDQSDADQAFVADLAQEQGLSFRAVSINIPPQDSIDRRQLPASEDQLRRLRYEALQRVASQTGARYLFTGHHQGDQAETILFRLFRGTGMRGLQGIPAIRNITKDLTLVRPFLEVARDTIELNLERRGQPYRSDPSNNSTDYTRNAIRHRVLPEAESLFPFSVEASICRVAVHASNAIELEQEVVDAFLAAHPLQQLANSGVQVDREALQARSRALVVAILMRLWRDQQWPSADMTFDRWQQLAGLIQDVSQPQCVLNLPGDRRIEIEPRWILVR